MKSIVRMENVSQTLTQAGKGPGGEHATLRDITLDIHEGECVGLVGAPGCGKSALLSLVAGHTRPAAGRVLCKERKVAGPGPDRALVFRNHALLPWLTCFDNVYLAVERVFGGREGKPGLKRRTHEALARFGLSEAETWFPHEISIGMKQRVGLARALAMQPAVLLLDDPFATLDAAMRASLQDELMAILGETGITLVLATSDADEAVLLSDRVVMLSRGRASAEGTLDVNFPRPRDRIALADDAGFVAIRQVVRAFLARACSRQAA